MLLSFAFYFPPLTMLVEAVEYTTSPLRKGKTSSNEVICWLWVTTCNASGWDPGG